MSAVHMRFLLAISMGLLLCACATNPQSTPESDEISPASTLDEIIEARSYMETAQSLDNEWRVAHPLTGNGTIRLEDLLELSEKAEAEGNPGKAREIALLVSTYSRLAIAQSRRNLNARPSYPRN